MDFNAVLVLQLSLVVISGVFAGASYMAWRLFGRPRHALVWTVAYLLAMFQYFVNVVRAWFPVDEAYWLTANFASYVLVIAITWGHRERLGLETRWSQAFVVFMLLAVTQTIFTLLIPRMDLRVALGPAFVFVAMAHISWLLLRHGPQPLLPQRVAAGVHFLFGLAQGVAAAIALQFGAAPSEQVGALYNLVNFAFMPSFFVAIGVTIIFLLATDLATRLRLQATTDQLTDVANRRGFLIAAGVLLAGAQREGRPLTLVLADIDFFKRINDRYGHTIGDHVLAHFAETLRGCVRQQDTIGRIGGEEFAVIMGGASAVDARQMISRIRKAMLEQPLLEGQQRISITASFGIAEWQDDGSIEELMTRADAALYHAKDTGRDGFTVAADRNLPGMVSQP
ncbi:hypothetical protein CWI75_04430 [Kineobactrum sediminis]|uniref:diguanylate cyclase n=1 Tax=Kineobactrum sediminis TaxID=1905677 RepID=A0A2N5Y5D4_9GAMM|nr:GGDEF domain-containing protein [Kineobactrum sediminis]PLW83603.1 hypothetical protein CWI75_04430 [Kineobactrum sediminis]